MDDLPGILSELRETCCREFAAAEAALGGVDSRLAEVLRSADSERDHMQRFVDELSLESGLDSSLIASPLQARSVVHLSAVTESLGLMEETLQQATALKATVELLIQLTRQSQERLGPDFAFMSVFDLDDALARQAMNAAREDERKRLAREIHDGPAQVMANAIFSVEIAEQISRRASPVQAADELRRVRTLLKEGVAEIRRFMFDLRPTMLEDQGLVPTVQRYVDDYSRFFGKRVSLRVIDESFELSPDEELTVFRTVQEGLQNIQKHAAVDRASVELLRVGTSPELVIRDSGKGFPADDTPSRRAGGSGLRGMRDRARLIGAELSITSEVGRGTEIRLRLASRTGSTGKAGT